MGIGVVRHRGVRWGLLLCAVVFFCPAPGSATSDELKCQDAIAKAARNYFKSAYKAISKCEDKKSAAKPGFDGTTNCRPSNGPVTDTKTADTLAKAEVTLKKKIDAKCTPSILASLTFGAPCLGVSTQVAECIVNDAHGADLELLIETVYDDTPVPIADAALGECQKEIAKRALLYADARLKERRKCAQKLMDGKIDGPCADAKNRQSFAKALDKLKTKVLEKCSSAQVIDPNIAFGFPCETFKNTVFDRDGVTNNNLIPENQRFMRCLAAAAAGDGDLGAETVFPLPDAAPFSFGVAAGDATGTSFIAWTRTDSPGGVMLEVATDPAFASIATTIGPLTPDAAADNTVRTDVTGLTADTPYYYRFKQGSSTSRSGRIRTAPAPSATSQFTFVWTGDSNAFFKPYSVLEGITGDDPAVWLYVGDTIYSDDARSGTGVAVTRGDYHNKYKENRADHALRDLMANVGTLAIWDDHEVTNDFWGTDPGIQTQMAAGNQAFRDYMPIRDDIGDPMRLYRSFKWGDVAEFFLTDDRQYRSAQAYVTEPACLDGLGDPLVTPSGACVTEINNPSRTYLGAAQKAWLKNGLENSTATWKFIINGPLISGLAFLPYDRWEGYAAERKEVLDFIRDPDGNTLPDDAINNVVFLSTDIHSAIVNEVTNPGPAGGSVPEWVAGAIGMDPIFRELPPTVAAVVPLLPVLFPSVKYYDLDRFTYALVTVSTTQATVTYKDSTGQILKTFTVAAVP